MRKITEQQADKLIIDFSEKYIPSVRQAEAHMAAERYVLFGGAMGGGKASAVDSVVRTPSGPKSMGNIRVGTEVSNPAGGVSTVVAVWPQGIKPVYKVIFSDCSVTRVTAEHLWTIRWTARSPYTCVSTADLKQHFDRGLGKPQHPFVPFMGTRRIVSIEPDGEAECQCITVDHPNGLYITDFDIVTHNSVWLSAECIQLCLDFPKNRGFICRHENIIFAKTTLLTLLEIMPTEGLVKQDKQEQYFEFINGSRLYYGGLRPTQSEKPLDRIKSWDLGFFAIDEASETHRDFFLMLCTRLRQKSVPSTAYKGLLTSNPEPGWLKQDFIDEPIPNSIFIPALPKDNAFLPDDYVEQLRSAFGSTRGWAERYLEGDWNAPMGLSGEFYVFTWGMVQAASQRELNVDTPVEMGIDVARSGTDKTVIYLRRGPSAMLLLDDHITDTMRVVEEARKLITRYNPSVVRVDAIGIGAGVYDRLSQLFGDNDSVEIVEFIAGANAVEGERFFNARSEALWLVRERCEKGDISIPPDNELKNQMSSIRYLLRSDKRVQIESKEAMRKRGMRSPDKLDALCLAFGGGALGDMFVAFG